MKKQFRFNPVINSFHRDAIVLKVRSMGYSAYLVAGYGGDVLITSANMSNVTLAAQLCVPQISLPVHVVYQDY